MKKNLWDLVDLPDSWKRVGTPRQEAEEAMKRRRALERMAYIRRINAIPPKEAEEEEESKR